MALSKALAWGGMAFAGALDGPGAGLGSVFIGGPAGGDFVVAVVGHGHEGGLVPLIFAVAPSNTSCSACSILSLSMLSMASPFCSSRVVLSAIDIRCQESDRDRRPAA